MIDNDVTAGAILRIDLEALAANYRCVADCVAPVQVAGVVKADAYGLGAIPVTSALLEAGCRSFFVAHLGEARALRAHFDRDLSVAILNGLHPGGEEECAQIGAIPVINALDQLDRWTRFARACGKRLPCMLQFDTGMSRLGLSPSEVDDLVANPMRLDGVNVRLLISHLACADEPDQPFNRYQADRFEALCDRFPDIPRSLDNSAGTLLPRSHYDVVRAGIALYGGGAQSGSKGIRPVVTLDARIIQLRTVQAGEAVGYGLTHRFGQPSRLATLSIGYADGWPRCLGGRGSAFIGGVRVPIVGRISMDSLTIDVTGVASDQLRPGGLVELIGPLQSLETVASDAGTISYEILTQLGRRYARTYTSATASPQDPTFLTKVAQA